MRVVEKIILPEHGTFLFFVCRRIHKPCPASLRQTARGNEAHGFGGIQEDNKQAGMSPKIADVVFLAS